MMNLLLLLLQERDRETIAGDLMEERRAKVEEIGWMRAQAWYGVQVLSFVPGAVVAGVRRHVVLTALCLFTALCGGWLGAMDLRLRHPGIGIALIIVAQAGLTLWTLALPARVFKTLTAAGTGAILWLAWKAFYGVTHDRHFEGYIVLIAFVLVIQAIVTWVALLRDGRQLRRA